MENNKPPLKIISPRGRVYRNEEVNATEISPTPTAEGLPTEEDATFGQLTS